MFYLWERVVCYTTSYFHLLLISHFVARLVDNLSWTRNSLTLCLPKKVKSLVYGKSPSSYRRNETDKPSLEQYVDTLAKVAALTFAVTQMGQSPFTHPANLSHEVLFCHLTLQNNPGYNVRTVKSGPDLMVRLIVNLHPEQI